MSREFWPNRILLIVNKLIAMISELLNKQTTTDNSQRLDYFTFSNHCLYLANNWFFFNSFFNVDSNLIMIINTHYYISITHSLTYSLVFEYRQQKKINKKINGTSILVVILIYFCVLCAVFASRQKSRAVV